MLPPTIALETAPVKSASIEKVLRLDDLVTCYVRRPEPASGRLEVGLEPASSETLASEAKARDNRRQARARRAAVTKRLEVGQRFRGVVLRRLAYGVSVDVGATGPGLVLRGDRDRDFVGVGDRVSVEVAAVEARDAGPPRLTLELVEEEEEDDAPERHHNPRRRGRLVPSPSPSPSPRRCSTTSTTTTTSRRAFGTVMSTKKVKLQLKFEVFRPLFSRVFFVRTRPVSTRAVLFTGFVIAYKWVLLRCMLLHK